MHFTGFLPVVQADTNSGTYFIYGEADEVAWYSTKNYPGKAVGTLTEVSFVVLVD